MRKGNCRLELVQSGIYCRARAKFCSYHGRNGKSQAVDRC